MQPLRTGQLAAACSARARLVARRQESVPVAMMAPLKVRRSRLVALALPTTTAFDTVSYGQVGSSRTVHRRQWRGASSDTDGEVLRDTLGVEGTFRLQRQTSRWARFAQVTVEVTRYDEPSVRLGDDTFGWRRAVYGPDAWPGPHDDELRREAAEGAWYALKQLGSPPPRLLVSVTEIVERTADTGPGDVKFAAVHAVWQAVGQDPVAPPHINQDGVPVIPS